MPILEGTNVDRYEIVEEIGKGSMGTVYLGQDSLIGRTVAIKILPTDPGEGSANALLREARAAGILSHPNIVTILDLVDRSNGSPPFIAMEYVSGSNLKEILDPGLPLPTDFVLSVVQQAASALDYAHSMGVIHGDIKPANLLIADDETVKLTDFGIAREMGGGGKPGKPFLGTAGYVAPEQLRGDTSDHRSDIFSLGVVVAQMLTGRHPFPGDSGRQILETTATEPPNLATSGSEELSDGLVDVIRRALAKDPDQRFQTGGDLAVAFEQVLATGGLLQEPTREPTAFPQEEEQSVPEPALASRFTRMLHSVRSTLQGLGGRGGIRPTLREPGLLRQRHRRRLLVTAGGVAAVTLAALIVSTLWVWQVGGSASETPSAEHLERVQYLSLVKQGINLLRFGDPEAATLVLATAEQIAPPAGRASNLRERAEREARDLGDYRQAEARITALLDDARRAMADGDSGLARTLAAQALALDLEWGPTRQLLEELSTNEKPTQARRRTARKPPPRPVPDLAIPPQPAQELAIEETPKQAPLPTGPSRLKVDFFSHLPRGVLTIYSGTQQILRRPFRFVKKKGLLRRKGISGRLEIPLELPAGDVDFSVYVSGENKSPQIVKVSGTLASGESRVLRVFVDEAGETQAQLN